MITSILTSVKKNLGIAETDTSFDPDVILHINSVFSTLQQLGVGPTEGFMIEDATVEWDAYLGPDINLNNVKTYMYLRVRLLFDPPQMAHHVTALDEQRKELEWRLNIYMEPTIWTDPNPTPDPPVSDGDFDDYLFIG